MRAFLLGCFAILVVGAAGYFVLDALQQPSGAAYTTDGARIDPSWSWRQTATAAQPCEPRRVWQWFFVDFRHPNGEPRICADSQ